MILRCETWARNYLIRSNTRSWVEVWRIRKWKYKIVQHSSKMSFILFVNSAEELMLSSASRITQKLLHRFFTNLGWRMGLGHEQALLASGPDADKRGRIQKLLPTFQALREWRVDVLADLNAFYSMLGWMKGSVWPWRRYALSSSSVICALISNIGLERNSPWFWGYKHLKTCSSALRTTDAFHQWV